MSDVRFWQRAYAWCLRRNAPRWVLELVQTRLRSAVVSESLRRLVEETRWDTAVSRAQRWQSANRDRWN